MSPSPHRPGEPQPPVPQPTRTPPPIEEPEPEDLPDEKRTPNPDEVREPPIHTLRYLSFGQPKESLSVRPEWAFAVNGRHQLLQPRIERLLSLSCGRQDDRAFERALYEESAALTLDISTLALRRRPAMRSVTS